MATMYELAQRLYPINRSLTGEGNRQTLRILQEQVPELQILEYASGTQVFDWNVPKEWEIRQGYIENEAGERIVDFAKSNLHILGYSTPVDEWVDLAELKKHIYVEETDPDVVPYVTSYYKERYGFCMSAKQRDSLPEGRYHMFIDSRLFDGSLSIGEVVLPGQSEEEVFFSTYICHPSLANNELSGPCVMTELIKWLKLFHNRRYTYRFLFLPETIGSITYMASGNLKHMQEHIVAGFNATCVGDERAYSYVASRYGDTLADKAAQNVLQYHAPEYKAYSYLQRGSDEKNYCMPGVDLPLCVICRTKFGEYPEYHTSADDLQLISQKGMEGALQVFQKCVEALEWNYHYHITTLCEPQLGKRGLYPTISKKGQYDAVMILRNILAYADGRNDLLDISNIIEVPTHEIIEDVQKFLDAGILKVDEADFIKTDVFL